MRDFLRILTAAAIGSSLAACGSGLAGTNAPADSSSPATALIPASAQDGHGRLKPLSSRARPANAADCSSGLAIITSVLDVDLNGACSHIQIASESYGPTTPAAQIVGYKPADLQSAYNLPSSTRGANQTIGIVVGGDDPLAQSDLSVYRSAFGLPACTSANGCFREIAVSAQPAADDNWAAEIAIDLDMVSATCPNCKVLLVEAKSSKRVDLAAAVAAAVANGATVVNNSYVISETKKANDDQWNFPGVPIIAAAGDGGYTSVANWPAASSHVIAVGGTTLSRGVGARGWSETAWARSGSSCSTIAPKPAWQHDTGCANRTVADVAAVADPATPVAVYDSYDNAGWVEMGGTSVAAPIVAGAYALAANGKSLTGASSLYTMSSTLFPITAGSTGSCSPVYLCTAGAGYDGPTGMGSINGIAAL